MRLEWQMNSTFGPAGDASLPSIADKVRFLSEPSTHAHSPKAVTVVETHMSYVFLAGERAYKLKKPVRFPFLDFSTLSAREFDCREELRLNSRLAAHVYLGVVPLTLTSKDHMSLGGEGAVIDWLVEMRRLPGDRMLDFMLREDRRLDGALIDDLSETLGDFYSRAQRSAISADAYVARFLREQIENRRILTSADFNLNHGRIPAVLDWLDASLERDRSFLEERVRGGRIVEGHGDLRPEHICFTVPIAIFDCLEFNRELRQVDPFDELAFLGMECAHFGAPSLGPMIISKVAERLSESPPPHLIPLYGAWRAVLRARLALAHLLDPDPRSPEKWEPLARRYLELAEEALGRF
jgi:aminoglycoside phosphotransferase family enzyme